MLMFIRKIEMNNTQLTYSAARLMISSFKSPWTLLISSNAKVFRIVLGGIQ